MNPTEPRPEGEPTPPRPEFEMELLTTKEEPPLVQAAPPLPVAAERPRYGFGVGVAFLWCLFFLLVAQIIPGVIGMIIYLVVSGELNQVVQDNGVISARALQVLMGVTHVAAIMAVVLILRWKAGPNWARKIALRLPDPRQFVLVLLGLPALLVVAHAVEQVVRLIPSLADLTGGTAPGVEAMIETTRTWPAWLAMLLIAGGPAIWEELFCRGFLGRGLTARYGFVGGVLVTSLFFGLIHVEPPQAVMAALLGVVIHTVYILTRSLLLPMLIHFLNNALVVLAISETTPVPFMKTLETSYEHAPFVFTLSALVLVSAIGYALYETRARLVPVVAGSPAWEPPCATVAVPPPASRTVIAHGPPSPTTIILVVAAAALFGVAWYGV